MTPKKRVCWVVFYDYLWTDMNTWDELSMTFRTRKDANDWASSRRRLYPKGFRNISKPIKVVEP